MGAKLITLKDLQTEGLFVCYNSYMNNSRVSFIRKSAALDLWEFGEDAYIEKALRLSDDDLVYLGERAYKNFNKEFYKKGGKSLPGSGYDIGYVTALTLIEYFEGNARPLKRGRRRSHAELPKKLEITEADYLGQKTKSSYLLRKFRDMVAKYVH